MRPAEAAMALGYVSLELRRFARQLTDDNQLLCESFNSGTLSAEVGSCGASLVSRELRRLARQPGAVALGSSAVSLELRCLAQDTSPFAGSCGAWLVSETQSTSNFEIN